jgi:hypothetical protein
MSQPLDIFVDTTMPLSDFVHELESLLGIEFEYVSADDEVWYVFDNPEIVLTVGTHTFENDRDLRFEEYRYDIELRPLNYRTESEWRERREKYAQLVFRALQATQKYPLLLVDDLQVKLAEYSPRSESAVVTA